MTSSILYPIGHFRRAAPSVCPRRCAALLSLIGLLALAGCSPALATFEIESARTTALVMTALVNDPEIGARPISVRVNRGAAWDHN